MQHIFIIGSKGIPAAYGGFETFVDKLTEYHQNNSDIKYHVACKKTPAMNKGEFNYHNAHCFCISVPEIGAMQAIYYDMEALKYCCNYIKLNSINQPIVYILACRIGPFVAHYRKRIHRLGGVLYVNPDGHEFLRAKWPFLVRKYWKYSERLMVKNADLLICDSKNIEKYICEEYSEYMPRTTYIAYGAETEKSNISDQASCLNEWYEKNGLSPRSYYLIVGRFVPENNFETMLREFMSSLSSRSLAIITTVDDKFLKMLESRIHFKQDERVKFVGTVYDQELLKKIRENAYAYLHGHEVGGTNPSLLEALGSTKVNLLYEVGFNREVAEEAALYWNKEEGNLASLINRVDCFSEKEIDFLGEKAKKKILNAYSWKFIANRYLDVFTKRKQS